MHEKNTKKNVLFNLNFFLKTKHALIHISFFVQLNKLV